MDEQSNLSQSQQLVKVHYLRLTTAYFNIFPSQTFQYYQATVDSFGEKSEQPIPSPFL